MINTNRIHGSLYDVFNQNFSIMSTEESRKIFSKVAIGPKTMDVVVHEDFQCIIHVKRSEFAEIPAPFLSRFQKYSINASDFYSTELLKIPDNQQHLLKAVEEKARNFIQHFGNEYFYGFNEETLSSCLLSLIKRIDKNDCSLVNLDENYNQLMIRSKPFVDYRRDDDECRYLSFIISKLLQLASPESIIFRWPVFHNEFVQTLRNEYFNQQEHLDLRNYLNRLISTIAAEQTDHSISIVRKLVIFTRTSSFIVSLCSQLKRNVLDNANERLADLLIPEKIHIVNLGAIDDSVRMKEEMEKFKQNCKQSICLIIVDGRIKQQRIHIPYIRYLIDIDDHSMNESLENPPKFFIILIHSSGKELTYKSSFPSIFLQGWDFWYVDTSTPGSSYHLKKSLEPFTTTEYSSDDQDQQSLFDLNILFDECLQDFCARLEITSHKPPSSQFENPGIYKFYLNETSISERLRILQTIFQRFNQLQVFIIKAYHDDSSKNEKSLNQSLDDIRRMAKDTLSGKSFNSVVDSLQAHIRISFSNFVAYTLSQIINDYGLNTLNKLSDGSHEFTKLLYLIDYSSLNLHNRNTSMGQGLLRFVAHYSCIPQTPLFNALRLRIEVLVSDIKLRLAQQQNQVTGQINELTFDDDYSQDINEVPTKIGTYIKNTHDDSKNEVENFRDQLVLLLANDDILTKIISPTIIQLYSKDLVQSLCSIIEKDFENNPNQSEASIEFICRWLLLIDEQERKSLEAYANQGIWQLAQLHSLLECEQNDLLSLYSACQITMNLDDNRSFTSELLADERTTRSQVLRKIFQSIFRQLWSRLGALDQNSDDSKRWIYSYTLISKYHSSKPVFDQYESADMQVRIEFMNLAYLSLLNDTTPQPVVLIKQMMSKASLTDNGVNNDEVNFRRTTSIENLPIIIQTIDQYFANKTVRSDTLMIDIQQWLISTLKSSQSPKEQLQFLLQYLKQPSCQLSLPMKQFLFDGLVSVMMEMIQQVRLYADRQFKDFWDCIQLLTIIMDSVNDDDLSNYQLPYHPSVIVNNNQKHVLIDLFFFHLRRLANNESNLVPLINKILQSRSPKTNNPRQLESIKTIHGQLQDYFLIQLSTLFLSQQGMNHDGQRSVSQILTTLINQYLKFNPPVTQLTSHIQLFCSIVIRKRSLNFLLNLLKSDQFQLINSNWANNLHGILQSTGNIQRTKSLQSCHQLHFTLSADAVSSIFPHLHQPYHQLNQLISQCAQNNNPTQRWSALTNWIQSKLNENPSNVNTLEIKVMILLTIYYDYYCNDRLAMLDQLLDIVDNFLQPSNIERKVFLVFLNPVQNMTGYTKHDNDPEKNYLNDLFNLHCQDEDELPIRHILVNLLSMILLSGEDNLLWTFAFDPLTLQDTFGFGSTRHEPVQAQLIHYDCGCLIHETGELVHFPNHNKDNGSPLTVPAVYIVYMATFGGMAWHLLLFDQSVNNLYGPVLAKHAIAATGVTSRIAGESIRAKVCHFVRARLFLVYNLLSIQFGQEDACLLFNRCFEQYAQFSRQPNQYPWIRSHYRTFEEKFQAEKQFQDQIFYSIHQNLAEHKRISSSLEAQNQLQSALQIYSSEMPMLIEFNHFKTELSNPRVAHLPLKILQHFLGSLDFLKITHYIYSLIQFHLLLHRTFNRMIEENEFFQITLQELYERACQYLRIARNSHLETKYRTIIENGIEAVNAYHKFADGFIRPGPCDLTQRFQNISMTTPVNYLVRTGDEEEGNIVKRILSVLIDFHNNLIEVLKNEIETNGTNLGLGPLKDIIIDLSKREVSILQIAESNLGVISINERDHQWIEQLARATLENENNYFLTYGSPLNFQFVYFQTYLIRTYLLYCRINYTHFDDKYQYHVQPRMPTVIERHDDIDHPAVNGSDLNEWNHLKFKSLDQLRNEFEFFQRLKTLLDSYPKDCSMMTLSEFIQLVSDDYRFTQQYEKYEIKDFPLSQVDYIREFYQQVIIRVQNAYNHVSSTIDVPMSDEIIANLDRALVNSFLSEHGQENKESLEGKMGVITDFLEELKDVQEDIAKRSSEPLAISCVHWAFESLILNLIPAEVKCENYVPLCVKLIEIRSQLQERSIAIQERNEEKWTAYSILLQVSPEDGNEHEHENNHIAQDKTSLEEDDRNVKQRLHSVPSSSGSESFDEDEHKMLDLDRSPSRNEDSQVNENKQKDSTSSQANFEDEGARTYLTEFQDSYENIEPNNWNHLNHPTRSRSNSEIVDVEEDKMENFVHSQSNLEKDNNLDQLTSQVETENIPSTQSKSNDSDREENTTVEESAHYPQLHLPYRFRSKLTAVSLTPAVVFRKTEDLTEKLKSNEVPRQFYITFADGTTEKKLSGGREKLYSKLKAAFEEKRYNPDSMAFVDSLDLFVDFTKTPVDKSLPRVDVNYRVVKKTALITVKIDFEKGEYRYQATELANLSSILARVIIDNNLQFDQLENYVSVFDTFGWYVDEDCPLSKFYRLEDSSSIDIRMIRWNQQMKICQMSRANVRDDTDEVKPEIDYFHLTTTWQQIDSRLNFSTRDTDKPIGNVYFWDMTRNIIINGDEQIGDTVSSDILALKQEDVMSIVLSYDQTRVNILMPKHCSVDYLLRNEIYFNQLNLKTSSPDYILFLVAAKSVTRVLANNELSQPIGSFQSNGENRTYFQIRILLQIFPYGMEKQESIPISHRNSTVQQLLENIQIDEDFQYLVSYETKRILPLDLSLSTIPDTKFFLARENQIGYLCIRRTANDKELSQCYLFDATIDDVYKQNQINEENRYLMLNNDFIPSRQTSLSLFLSASKTASIVFTITDEKLAVNLTVIDKEGDRSISFLCAHSILTSRLIEIVCNLWKLKQRFYRLKTTDDIVLDSQESIADYNESIDHLQMTLETKTNIKCTISYQERNITIPSDDDVLASAIMEEALERLYIPLKQKTHYSLFSVNDADDPVRFESEDSIENLRSSLEESPEHLLFELRLIQHANSDE